MYDHNQIVIPDAFMAFYVERGRPTLSREELEARYDIAEDLANQVALFCQLQVSKDVAPDEALRRCYAGLLEQPDSVSPPEAAWVVCRVAELLEWASPTWLEAAQGAAQA